MLVCSVLGKNFTGLIFKVGLAQVQHLPKLPPSRSEGQKAGTSPKSSVWVFEGTTAGGGSAGLTFNILVLICELYSSKSQSELRVVPFTAYKGLGSLNPSVKGLKHHQ